MSSFGITATAAELNQLDGKTLGTASTSNTFNMSGAASHITYSSTTVPTTTTIAWWNGAYNASNNSNLQYCNRGAFGSIVTKAASDYLSASGGSISGSVSVDGSVSTTGSISCGNIVWVSDPNGTSSYLGRYSVEYASDAGKSYVGIQIVNEADTSDVKGYLRVFEDGTAATSTGYILTTGYGTATAATKLATARTFRVELASTDTASFNGTAACRPGVNGILPVANGGTGYSTAADFMRYSLCNNVANASPAYVIGFNSGWTSFGYVSVANLRTAIGAAASSHVHNSLTRGTSTHGVIVSASGYFCPTDGTNIADNVMKLGSGSGRWNAIYASTTTITTSDAREKYDINILDDADLKFIKSLELKSFKLVNGDSGRVHYGFIAQELKGKMTSAGIDDRAVYIESPTADNKLYEDCTQDELTLGLRYEELIAPMLKYIQHLEQRVEN